MTMLCWGSSASDEDSTPNTPEVIEPSANAPKAETTPQIDGVIDDAWTIADKMYGDQYGGALLNERIVESYASLLWDEDGLYLLGVMYDTTIPDTGVDTEARNSIDFWVSETYTDDVTYDNHVGDWHYGKASTGEEVYYTGNATVYDESTTAVCVYDDHYVIEIFVPWQTEDMAHAAGDVIGFNVSFNDDVNGDGERDMYSYWGNTAFSDAYWAETMALPRVTLTDDISDEPADTKSSLGEIGKVADGAITVDGAIDAAYGASIAELNSGAEDGNASASVYMRWTDNGAYVCFMVDDPDIQQASDEIQTDCPWDADSAEVFFDFTNEGSGNIYQYRVDNLTWPSYYVLDYEGNVAADEKGSAADSYFHDYAVQYHDDNGGYTIEMYIDLSAMHLAEGDEIGINFQLNDAMEDGNVARYTQGPDSWSAAYYDYIVLGSTGESEPPATDSSDAMFASVTGKPGETIYLDFIVDDITTTTLGVNDITFSADLFTVDMSNIEILIDSDFELKNITDTGIVLTSSESFQLTGTMLRIPMIISEDAENGTSYQVSCTARYEDENGDLVNMDIDSGTITISSLKRGDVNGDDKVNSKDAILLLWHSLYPEDHTVTAQSHDYNGDGKTNSKDAIVLLWHALYPEDYPIQ